VLQTIYGSRDPDFPRDDLFDFYLAWRYMAKAPEDERAQKGYATIEQCRKNVVREIEKEIRPLRRDQKAQLSMEPLRTELEMQSWCVPDAPVLDR